VRATIWITEQLDERREQEFLEGLSDFMVMQGFAVSHGEQPVSSVIAVASRESDYDPSWTAGEFAFAIAFDSRALVFPGADTITDRSDEPEREVAEQLGDAGIEADDIEHPGV
jgi:hypothetical protein